MSTARPAGPTSEIRVTKGSDGGRLEYEVAGEGPPLVLLHGAFTGRSAWSRQRSLAERWRLIIPSARAHDGSGGVLPSDYGVASSDVADLEAVLAAERLDRFHLVGHSSGGATAFAFARKRPEAIDRLVLIEPTLLALLPDGEKRAMDRDWGRIVEIAGKDGPAAGLDAAMVWLGGEGWARLDASRRQGRLEAMAPLAHITGPHLQALLDFQVSAEDVARLPVGVLLVYGRASYPMEASLARRLAELRPEWGLLIVDGAGHNCFREEPELVNAAITRHLGG